LKYHQAGILSYCGQKPQALKFLQKAVSENYCAYSGLQSDPIFANIRGEPEFKSLIQSAGECQRRVKESAQGMRWNDAAACIRVRIANAELWRQSKW
jgi:hypothetical protein